MNFMDMVLQDNQSILQTDGQPTNIHNISSGTDYADVYGLVNHIGFSIDPQTGTMVSGDFASVTYNLETLYDIGLTAEMIIENKNDYYFEIPVNRSTVKMKVQQTIRDRHIALTILLEALKIVS